MWKKLKETIVSDTHSEPDEIPGMSGNRRVGWAILVVLGLLFWGTVLTCAFAAGRQVYLEDERDLGNGYKLCIYTEGVTITRQSYQLCPISIEV